jgi:hypothetical protein
MCVAVLPSVGRIGCLYCLPFRRRLSAACAVTRYCSRLHVNARQGRSCGRDRGAMRDQEQIADPLAAGPLSARDPTKLMPARLCDQHFSFHSEYLPGEMQRLRRRRRETQIPFVTTSSNRTAISILSTCSICSTACAPFSNESCPEMTATPCFWRSGDRRAVEFQRSFDQHAFNTPAAH